MCPSRVVGLLRDREGSACGDAEFVLGVPPFFEVDVAVVSGSGGGNEASTLLTATTASDEVFVSYSDFSGTPSVPLYKYYKGSNSTNNIGRK
jgi:hypothetical protein